jgi:molybdopterin/thiamine biosynthesis adenylyltransferase
VRLVIEDDKDRFSRFRLISWWEQERLARAKALVIGAGALGNEILKNLALLGFGNILVVDLDRIENSNLSRSVLFRPEDEGRPKALTACEKLKEIYPDAKTKALDANVTWQVGMGVFLWADVVLGGLDGREARLFVNRSAYFAGKPFIDGAIQELQGTARVFLPPEGPCYECTMSEKDWEIINHRRSCNLLRREDMLEGKIPTTPTVASVIGAVQCQEAVKMIHGLESLAGKGFVFDGRFHNSYLVEYERNPDCMSHFDPVALTTLSEQSGGVTPRALLERARNDLEDEAQLCLRRDIVSRVHCPECNNGREVFKPLQAMDRGEATCPKCDAPMSLSTFSIITGEEDFLDRSFTSLGLPPYDVVTASCEDSEIGYLFGGDRDAVLGDLEG